MPLAGKTVVVTRGAADSQEWQQKLAGIGANVYNLPTIMTSPVAPNVGINRTLAALGTYDWMVFTSASGVRYLVRLCAQLGIDLSVALLPKVAVIGSRTASMARYTGLRVSFEPSVPDSAHLASELNPVQGKRILLFRTTIASDHLPVALMARGANVTDQHIYKTEPVAQPDPAFSRLLANGTIDYITFASPSAVAGFESRLNEADLALARKVPAISIGPSVTEALHRGGFRDIYTAEEASVDGVIAVLQGLSA